MNAEWPWAVANPELTFPSIYFDVDLTIIQGLHKTGPGNFKIVYLLSSNL